MRWKVGEFWGEPGTKVASQALCFASESQEDTSSRWVSRGMEVTNTASGPSSSYLKNVGASSDYL